MSNNLILIGMPGVGKSTVGVLLAKQLGFDFVDTDLLLQRRLGLRLQQMINLQGLNSFRTAEERMLLEIDYTSTVVATGGSVVYSEPGMERLKALGQVIYLKISLPLLARRIFDMGQRGVVIAPGQSFADLYAERTPLYVRHADLIIEIDGLGIEAVLQEIEKEWQEVQMTPPATLERTMKTTELNELIEAGTNALGLGEPLKALALFERAAELEATTTVRSSLAYCIARERGQVKTGRRTCEELLVDEPDNFFHYLNLGRILLLDGDRRGAIETFRAGLQREAHPQIIAELAELGIRKHQIIGFLQRDNPLNKYLGMLRGLVFGQTLDSDKKQAENK